MSSYHSAVHIRNGRKKSLSHVYGGGETWCGKKIVGESDAMSGDVEKFIVYGNALQVTIDPALGDCPHCRSAFDAAYSTAFPDGLKPIATFRLENSEEMALAKDLLSPEGIKRLMGRDGQRCSMGVGCDEYGVCYAEAHGRPEMCPQQEPTNG